MGESACTVLVIGYGNPGRLDDGLGPALAEAVAKLGIDGVTVDSDYQLTVEDAAEVAKRDVAIFADASVNDPEPFSFREIEPTGSLSFTTHDVEPAAVLALAHKLFAAKTRGYILAIRGYEFNEFGEHLSPKAMGNLDEATRFLTLALTHRDFTPVRAEVQNKDAANDTTPPSTD